MSVKPDQHGHPGATGVDAGVRRRAVVRTALVVGAIAVLIYVGFILTGVLAQ